MRSPPLDPPDSGAATPSTRVKRCPSRPRALRSTTGNSAVAAVDRLKEQGARNVRIVCLLATAQSIERVRGAHPDVAIWTAAVDDSINEQGYILPGIGDVGDRMYGTR